MSKTFVSPEIVKSVEKHPNADRLDIVMVMGYKAVTSRGQFSVGDLVVYFPPGMLICESIAGELGVANYLKHAIFPGDVTKTKCRVGAAKIRGVPSHGFVVPVKDERRHRRLSTMIGEDISAEYMAHKYVPPVREGCGDSAPELENFPKYTEIENIQRYPDAIPYGTPVALTEKIHGTNCRLGLVRVGDEFQFVAGSPNTRRQWQDDAPTLYWQPMTREVMNLLSELCDPDRWPEDSPRRDVVVYGEIFGPGVQDLDYGQTEKAFRVFDISVDGRYIDYWDMVMACDRHGILTVPLLATGDFTHAFVERHTYGDTMFNTKLPNGTLVSAIRSEFKGREGCVIRPLHEQFSDVLGGRMILKSISAEYESRNGAKDDE